MKRRKFIKKITLSGIAIASFPNFIFGQQTIAYKELIGKGKPILYGENYQLRVDAHLAFQKMKAAAKKDNIAIQVVSSYRSFDRQKKIWERKYKRYRSQGLSEEKSIQKIIKYSTIPGTSRHHWGTDIDIIDSNVKTPKYILREENFHRDGPYIYLKKWMDKNASKFGFHLVYTNNSNRNGFKYEPWHYSYKPLSKNYLNSFRSLNIKQVLQEEDILGKDFFSEAFIKKYLNENILDINPELL